MTPFEALGLPATAGLTDDDVRAAWRRVAAATHPDRTDGGDPAAFAAAAAAYTALRTRSGRGEALADLRGPAAGTASAVPVPGINAGGRRLADLARLIRQRRPARQALRLMAATAVSLIAVLGAGTQPAAIAVVAGALTWLYRASRRDLGR